MSSKTKFKIRRKLTTNECHWLDNDIEKGTIVYHYGGATYGCISAVGIAVSMEPNKEPFFEVPFSAVEEIDPTPDKAGAE